MTLHPNCRQGLESQLTEAFGCLCSTQGWRLTQAVDAGGGAGSGREPVPSQVGGRGVASLGRAGGGSSHSPP